MESAVRKKPTRGSLLFISLVLATTGIGITTQSALADAISQERKEKQKRYLEMRERERAEKKKAKQQDKANKAAKRKNCERARIRLNEYKTAGALFDLDKNGKKVYLDKSSRKKAEDQAASDVKKWCR